MKLCVSLSEMPQNMQSGASDCVHFFIFFNSDCWCQVCSTRSRNSEWSLSCSSRKSVIASCSVTASCATMFSAGTTSRSALHTSTEKNSDAMTCKSKIVLAWTSHGTTANHWTPINNQWCGGRCFDFRAWHFHGTQLTRMRTTLRTVHTYTLRIDLFKIKPISLWFAFCNVFTGGCKCEGGGYA